MKVLCEGTGKRGVPLDNGYPSCPDCGREFSAQGRKAQARLGNPWVAIPKHYTEQSASRVGDVPVDDINGSLAFRAQRPERCPVCGGLNPGDATHTRC